MSFRSQKQLMVRAPKGTSCSMPGNRLITITDTPVAAPNTRLVRQAIAEGSLELVTKSRSPVVQTGTPQSDAKPARAKSKKGDS